MKSRQRSDQSAVMSCSAIGMGPIHYRWEKYESTSNEWITPSKRTVNITSSKLIFSVITEEDEGVYRCIVSNDDGSIISDSATLTVYGEYTEMCLENCCNNNCLSIECSNQVVFT